MLGTNLLLPDARTELQKLFGDKYENEIWAMCCRINDLDPDEWEEKTAEIAKELEAIIVHKEQPTMNDEEYKEEEVTMNDEEYEEEEVTMNGDESEEEEVVMEEQETCEQKLLAAWVASNYNGTTTMDYQIFAIRCMASGVCIFDNLTFLTCIEAR